MITIWDAIILGLVQGLTEFIPVSSSAHLNIAHRFLGHGRNLTFDVMLHIGTLTALVWYFRHDWKALLFDPTQAKLRNLILLGCVPAAILGVYLHGLAGDLAAEKVGEEALIASDIIENLGAAIKKLQKKTP